MKRQEVKVTEGSIYAALSHAVLSLIEDLAEGEQDIRASSISPVLLSPAIAVTTVKRHESIEVYIPSSVGASEELEIADHRVRITITGPKDYFVHALRLYETSFKNVLTVDRGLYLRLGLETTETGVEFMLLYTSDGHLLTLEGERYRVRIPRVKVAMAFHTHPEGHCGLSKQDLESAVDLLTEGGLASGSVTPSCAAVVYRLGMVNEDDYLSFKAGKGVEGRTIRVATVAL
ncbi:MAG: hypothetical protein ACP5HK_05100 [Acidilobus sp.]